MINWLSRKGFLVVIVGILIGIIYQSIEITENECPIVNTTLGSLKGYTTLSRDGREFFAFLGIPFAEPPVGPLRFEPPIPAKGWTGLKQAVNFGADCAQMSIIMGTIESYEEDCLFLNIYTPARNLSDPSKQFSVMVFIYGGMFMEGKSSIYGAKFFMDEDVVLVTFNYRIGALGFLNTGDEKVRGNMGLKDQNLALRWIKDNIKHFGGNPNDITIFGQSAGAASVHFHMISPMSKGLFSKAISQSGVVINPWAVTPDPQKQAFRLGTKLGCSNTSTLELVECLKKLPVMDILATHEEVVNILRDPISVYTPTVEVVNDSNAFLLEHPLESIKHGRFAKVPWMTGVTGHEGLIISALVVRNDSIVKNDLESWKQLAKHGLYYSKENPKLTDEIKEEYFGSALSVDEYGRDKFFRTLTSLFSDRHFNTGFVRAILQHSKYAPTFPYIYNYTGGFSLTHILLAAKGETNVYLEVAVSAVLHELKKILGIEIEDYGVCHSDEVMILFNVLPGFMSAGINHKDYEMSKALVKLWTAFAQLKTNQNELEFNGIKWISKQSRKDHDNKIDYLFIDNDEVKIINTPFGKRLEFWDARKDIV